MLSKDFKEFIELLNKHQVKYLIVGGYAVALHGYPRYTKNLDFWIENSHENASSLLKALDEFGFGSLGLQISDFMKPDMIIQLGYPPERIDICTTLTGLSFSDCYPLRREIFIDQLMVNFLDKDNLIKNKLSTGKLQDISDAEKLK